MELENTGRKILDTQTVYEVNGEEIKLTGNIVKQFLTSGDGSITDQEIVMFINLCKYQKLNPFLNEAYLIKFGNQPAQIIVSKEAFMKRAEANSHYAGLEAGIIVERENDLVEIEGAIKLKNDRLAGGWAKVYRNDREKPIVVKIALNEFSKGQATWNVMPMNMIRKTAIVNALREAFPDNLGAMYTEEESIAETKQVIPVEETIKQEIQEHANGEIVDFDEPIKEKPAARKEVTEVKEKIIEQDSLFDERKPPLPEEPAF